MSDRMRAGSAKGFDEIDIGLTIRQTFDGLEGALCVPYKQIVGMSAKISVTDFTYFMDKITNDPKWLVPEATSTSSQSISSVKRYGQVFPAEIYTSFFKRGTLEAEMTDRRVALITTLNVMEDRAIFHGAKSEQYGELFGLVNHPDIVWGAGTPFQGQTGKQIIDQFIALERRVKAQIGTGVSTKRLNTILISEDVYHVLRNPYNDSNPQTIESVLLGTFSGYTIKPIVSLNKAYSNNRNVIMMYSMDPEVIFHPYVETPALYKAGQNDDLREGVMAISRFGGITLPTPEFIGGTYGV